MRKAGLLDKKPLAATAAMLETARKDTGTVKKAERWYDDSYEYTEYETRFYFRAVVYADRGLLEIDLFTRKDLAAGMKQPGFRIFLDREKKDFISWNMREEKWSSAKIDMLEPGDDRYRYSYRGRNHATKETLRVVNRYLKTGCMLDVEMAVLYFQAKIRKLELSKKHRLVTDIIDGYMDMVPGKLPADWLKFINDRALEHSIFYERKKKTGFCTHCRLHVPVPADVRHNMPGRCRGCGGSITYKSWNKQKHMSYRTTAALLQKCTDEGHYVYRQFSVYVSAERDKSYMPEISAREHYRQIFLIKGVNSMVNSARAYEWGTFKTTGIDRWCEAGTVSHGIIPGGGDGYARSVLYTGNITRMLKDTGLRYVPAADIIKSVGRERINVMAVLNDMQMHFPYEALWKMGMRRFVQDRILRGGTPGMAHTEHYKGNPRPWEYIKLTKEGMKQAVRLDAGDRQVRILQLAAEAGVKLTDGQAEWLDRHMGVHTVMNYFNVQTPHRIMRYLREAAGVESCGSGRDNMLLHLWTDYLYTARQLGWDLHDRSVFFPQDIQRAHDEAAAAFAICKDKADAEKMKIKDAIMYGNAREIKKAFCYRDSKYMIRIPGCFLDFKHEGNAQHNCVATYYDRAVKGECIILFIRRRKAPNESFCTVEIQNDGGKFVIMQNRAAYNRDAPEDAKAFMRKAVGEAQKIADRMAAEDEKRIRVKAEV